MIKNRKPKAKNIHPRPYLSHSQKKLWKQSPKQYIEKYLHNGTQFVTREMAFGKLMAVSLEEESESKDPILNEIMHKLPQLDKKEMDLKADMKIDGEILPLYAKMDQCQFDFSAFRELKTGKAPWTQKRVDEDSQITFYATTIYVATQKIVRDIELIWVPTYNDPNSTSGTGISATGEIITLKTQRTMGQIINELADMRKVWREIGISCDKELI